MIIDLNPEFGLEITLGVTYAYWLHERGELEKIRTVKGMKPFYYFHENVEEVYEHRTIDNANAGLNNLPNNWIHHNAMSLFGKGYGDLTTEEQHFSNGRLDYSKWSVPPYKKVYSTDKFNSNKPTIFISNRYNLEHGQSPLGYFDIPFLSEIFNYLTENGYDVIYKRPKNTEFALDENESHALLNGYTDIISDVEGIGRMTDYQLTEYYDNITLMDDLIISSGYKLPTDTNTYNKIQLQILSSVDGFISMGGGGSLLCSMFGVPNISYFNTGTECTRQDYFGEGNYYTKMSNHDFYPILDPVSDIRKRGYRDYTQIQKKIEEVFNG